VQHPDNELESTLIRGHYSSTVAKPAANPGIEVRSHVRQEATLDPRVAPLPSQANNLQQNNLKGVESIVRKSNRNSISIKVK
jgi:hypothetical protein